MTLIALGVALFLERIFSHVLHLRQVQWFDSYFGWGLSKLQDWRDPWILIGVGLLVLLLVVPIFAIQYGMRGWLYNIPLFAFSVFVLIVSLGPRDLPEETDEYVHAALREDDEAVKRLARELLEKEPPEDPEARQQAVAEAILVQANNRIFGVVFWFAVLGPVGAWLFRISDMLRRREAFVSLAHEKDNVIPVEQAHLIYTVMRFHGFLAWIPSRLVALGYALAGSFEEAVQDWRRYYESVTGHFFEVNEAIVAAAGCGALGKPWLGETTMRAEAVTARAAMSLVTRTLLIWLTAIALLTLAGWAVR